MYFLTMENSRLESKTVSDSLEFDKDSRGQLYRRILAVKYISWTGLYDQRIIKRIVFCIFFIYAF